MGFSWISMLFFRGMAVVVAVVVLVTVDASDAVASSAGVCLGDGEASRAGDASSWGDGDGDQSLGFLRIPGRLMGEAGALVTWDGDDVCSVTWLSSWWRLTIVWNDCERSTTGSRGTTSSATSSSASGNTKESFSLAFGFGEGGGSFTIKISDVTGTRITTIFQRKTS